MDKETIGSILDSLGFARDRLLMEKRKMPLMSVEAVLLITAIRRIDETRHLLGELLKG